LIAARERLNHSAIGERKKMRAHSMSDMSKYLTKKEKEREREKY
jgi:hypothetical protein